MYWDQALFAAEGFSTVSYPDWRLPNAVEILTLVDVTKADGQNSQSALPDAFAATIFDSCTLDGDDYVPFGCGEPLWTSTSVAWQPATAFLLNVVDVPPGRRAGQMGSRIRGLNSKVEAAWVMPVSGGR